MKRCRASAFLAGLLLASCALDPCMAFGTPKQAVDLTPRCSFTVSSNSKEKANLSDGDGKTVWTASSSKAQWVQVTFPDGAGTAGIYIQWASAPKEWVLEAFTEDHTWQEITLAEKASFLNAYIPLDPTVGRIRIMALKDWKPAIAEIRVFSAGELRADVQIWQPTPQKADLMVIPAHPDDEFIYFGGTLPFYAGQLKKSTVVVYMTSSPFVRKREALDGLWLAGVRVYPVFLPLANKYSSTVADAEPVWDGLDNTVALLTEQIRRCKPDVIVTHDLDGEYGHGAHKLTALAVTKALDTSGDPERCRDSAERYGVWAVKKCYLHLYGKHKLKMDWRSPLPAFGGETALGMAKACYGKHVSQHFRDRPVVDSGAYDNSRFGLYHTAVGQDNAGDDFFEHVAQVVIDVPSSKPSPTPKPEEATPAATQESVEAAAAIAKGKRQNQDGALALRVFLAFGAVALLSTLLAAYRHYDRKQAAAAGRRGQSRYRGRQPAMRS